MARFPLSSVSALLLEFPGGVYVAVFVYRSVYIVAGRWVDGSVVRFSCFAVYAYLFWVGLVHYITPISSPCLLWGFAHLLLYIWRSMCFICM